MAENTIRFNSLRDLMQADLAQIPEKMKQAGLEALNEAADFMIVLAQGYVLVDTGTLQRSIRKEHEGDVIRVLAGGYSFINPKTNKYCNYAVFIESKYPFMRPAFESVRSFITEKIRQKVLEKLQP